MHFRARRLVPIVAALTILLTSFPAVADLSILQPLDELARVSPVVVRGHVYAVDSAWDAGSIYTYVTLDVAETLRGDVPTERITLKQLGGTVGEMGMYAAGQALFSPGEEVLVYLSIRPRDRTLMTAVLWQGKWIVDRSGGPDEAQVVRYSGLDSDGNLMLNDTRPLSEVERVTHEALLGARREAEMIVFSPPEAPAPVNTVDSPVAAKIPLLGYSWHEVFAGSLRRLRLDKTKQPGVGSGKKQAKKIAKKQNAIAGSLAVWKRGSKYNGSAKGSSLRDPSCLSDIVIFNSDPSGELANDGTLAVGGAFFYNNIKIRGLNMACNGFVILNDGSTADGFNKDKTCYQNILNHEVMHVGGLGHSTKKGNLMFWSVDVTSCKSGDIAYGKDDKKGFKKIYKKSYATREGS
jgi:hypothetical protein